MTLKMHTRGLATPIGALTLLILTTVLADRSAAQAVDLGALGINWNFEQPALTHSNTGEATAGGNPGPGWTLEVLAGAASDHGVQDPNRTFYGPFVGEVENPPGVFTGGTLPAPFEGRQLGYINLNDDSASRAQLVSDSIGGLLAGQTYTLNVAVGARATDDWANVRYDVGLRTLGGVDLGTFATTTLDPSVATPTNIADLTYTLNVTTQAAAFVGQEVRIVIRGENVGGGPSPPDFVQANFDNVRLSGSLAPANKPTLTINRVTGAVTLGKSGPSTFNIAGYQLSSDTFGSFNQATWTKISVAYDDSGNGSVDPDNDWTVLSPPGSTSDLSEAELEGGNGGSLTPAGIALGTPWLRTPYEDVTASILLTDGTELTVPVTYTGNAIALGDLNADGAINTADWTQFKNGHTANLDGLSIAQAYPSGDMNRDRKRDLADFSLFRTAFDAANGVGAFAAMVGSMPEPGSFTLGLCGIAGVAAAVRKQRCSRSRRVLKHVSSALVAGVMIASAGGQAFAQSTIAHWSFDASTITTDANGILTAADETGAHNALRTNAATGALPINSVTGQFGQAAQFTNIINEDATGASRLQIPNLTEIMGPSGGDFTVAAWVNTSAVGQDNTILSDWVTTHTYWFQLDNSSATTARPRGQIRNTTGADIIAATLSAAETTTAAGVDNLADGTWRHVAWTWEKTPGMMSFYIDGNLAATRTTAQTDKDLRVSGNANAHIGWKQDSNDHFSGTLDELWVVNGALSAEQVNNLKVFNNFIGNALTLRIDLANGQMQIRNDRAIPLDLSSYQITSAAGGLDAANWSRLATQGIAGFPAGNGTGNGWEAGPSPSSNELVEWYLQGSSTLAPGAAVGLGSAYNEFLDVNDILFRYTNESGSVVTGQIEFGTVSAPSNPADFNGDSVVNGADLTVWRANFGSASATKSTGDANADGRNDGTDFLIWQRNVGATSAVAAAAAVPEPTALLLLATAGVGVVLRQLRSVRLPTARRHMIRASACLAALLTLVLMNSAQAAYTLDRDYSLGDDPAEGAAAGAAVNITFDSQGTVGTGTLHDLSASGTAPTYVSVNSGPLARPGADGALGIQFDGVDDFLTGAAFNRPSTTPSSTGGGGPLDYTGLSNRGFQLWVRPEAGGPTNQSVVRDTDDHGVMIEGGTWRMRYDEATTNSGVAVVNDQWHHVMVVRPFGAAAPTGGSILYLNGVAIAADVGDYGAAPAANENLLVVGANLAATPADFFKGTLDHLEMFVLGRTANGVDRGTFNFATDNKYAASVLSGVPGDVDQMNGLTQADVTAFVAGWKSRNVVNGVQVGDVNTIKQGDLNFDGVTSLKDVALLRSALAAAGLSAAGLNALGVPEPSTFALAAPLAWALFSRRPRPRAVRT
jgi:hypothetical protein